MLNKTDLQMLKLVEYKNFIKSISSVNKFKKLSQNRVEAIDW